jgi:hypothetical protein
VDVQSMDARKVVVKQQNVDPSLWYTNCNTIFVK